MYQYRFVLARMQRGDTDRELARGRYMGRRKLGELRQLATERGWLAPGAELPDDQSIAAVLGTPRRASSTVSGLEAHRDRIAAWLEQGVAGTAILAALKRNHGYAGSYSSLYRMMASIQASRPPEATIRLEFAPGEAAQVDFGAGPVVRDAAGVERRTWAFVMTLAFSRHQYVARRQLSWPAVLPHSAMLPSGSRRSSSEHRWSKAVGMWAKARAVGNA
ncbi:MAG: hypothetical protein LC121_19540 [Anaerolineae bacterium]|nr:hypothetical protein [Anaerolineae bacterium]MCZ2098412.1 hypothetical protein [Anaerolineae bacterium]